MLVQVLSIPQCAECKATLEALTRLSGDNPAIQLEWVNIADRAEDADRYGLLSFEYDLLSADAVAIDGKLAGVGHPSEETLRAWLEAAPG
jgi:hypothetical protein